MQAIKNVQLWSKVRSMRWQAQAPALTTYGVSNSSTTGARILVLVLIEYSNCVMEQSLAMQQPGQRCEEHLTRWPILQFLRTDAQVHDNSLFISLMLQHI